MDSESAEYGFMATRDEAGLLVSDSNGGSTRYPAFTREETVEVIWRYIRVNAESLAECMADDLFDEDASDGED